MIRVVSRTRFDKAFWVGCDLTELLDLVLERSFVVCA